MSKIDDNHIMPFGKFKGEKIANVPAHHLISFYHKCNRGVNNKFYRFNREAVDNLFDYIKENYEDLEQEAMREQVKKPTNKNQGN